jgi:small subunit ribosomal protein S3
MKGYADALHEDLKFRRFIKERVYHAGVSGIDIERKADQIRVVIHTARPGIIIGKKGSEVDKLKAALSAMTKKPIQLDIVEVRRAELDAQLIAEQIASQLMRRVAFRRAMKKTVQSSMRLGAQGVQIACAGRSRHRLRVHSSQDNIRADWRQVLGLPRRGDAGDVGG